MSKYWEIYEQELHMLGHGLPIWEAEPFSVRDEVHAGDVGYMYEGRFRRVFNVFYDDTSNPQDSTLLPDSLLPSDLFIPFAYERPHPNVYGMPSGHVPLAMHAWEFAIHGHIPQGAHSGERCQLKEVRPHASIDPSGPVPVEVGASLAFTSERRRGAALFLRSDGVRWQAPARWEPWREFTRACAAHSEGADQLMFVYGHTKTTAWTCVAVEQSRAANAISLDVELPALGSGGLEFRQSMTLTGSPHVNHGPWHLEGSAAAAAELKRNQTMFIRRLMASDRSSLDRLRYKMTYRIGRREAPPGGPEGDKLAKAPEKERQQTSSEGGVRSPQGASQHSPNPADLADFDMNSVLPEEDDDDVFHIDPLEILALYILEAEPNAHRVVVSDDDDDGLLDSFKALHAARPESMAKLLDQLKPDTYVDPAGFGYILTGGEHTTLEELNAPPTQKDVIQPVKQETPASISEVQQDRIISGASSSGRGVDTGSQVFNARLAFWMELHSRSVELWSDLWQKIQKVKNHRDKLSSLQHQCLELLDAFKAFLQAMSPGDLDYAGKDPQIVTLFEGTAHVMVSLHRWIIIWANWSTLTSAIRTVEMRTVTAGFTRIIQRYKNMFTEARMTAQAGELICIRLSKIIRTSIIELPDGPFADKATSIKYLQSIQMPGDDLLGHAALVPTWNRSQQYALQRLRGWARLAVEYGVEPLEFGTGPSKDDKKKS